MNKKKINDINNGEFSIKEAIKTNQGKLVYVIEFEQDGNKLQMYINHANEIHFESNNYAFNSYTTFDMSKEAHLIAKEIFLSHLQTHVKVKLLEIKQLELILDQLGMINIIRKSIVDNSSILLNTKNEIIEESIQHTTRLLTESTEKINENISDNVGRIFDDVNKTIAGIRTTEVKLTDMNTNIKELTEEMKGFDIPGAVKDGIKDTINPIILKKDKKKAEKK